jgi:hypothetical protein
MVSRFICIIAVVAETYIIRSAAMHFDADFRCINAVPWLRREDRVAMPRFYVTFVIALLRPVSISQKL